MKRCTTCILPSTYPGIEFSTEGQCNLCRKHQQYQPLGYEALQDVITPFLNRKAKYDCITAVSGGRDSSYVLAYVVDELKIRPLAITVDNGFMPEEIRKNIDKAIRILGVDHVYVPQRATMKSFSATLKAWQHHPDPATIGFLCNGCQGSIKKAVIQAARDNNVSLVIGGGGELVGSGGEPEGSFAEPLLRLGSKIRNRRLALVWGALKRVLSNREYLFSPSVLASYMREAYYRYWVKYPKDLTVVGLFNYLDWDEDQIVSTIHHRLGWTKPSCWNTTWRADCKVHWVKEFLYKETLGFTKNDELLSGMVREGMISRDKAISRLATVNDLPEKVIGGFLAEHGVGINRVREACQRWRTTGGVI